MHDREGSHGAGAGADHGSAARRDPGRRTRTEHMQRRMRGVDVQFGAEPEPGPEAEPHASAGGGGNCDPGTMGSLYYGINPPRHAEKAYQPCDPAPPLHPRPTTVGKSGTIVALVTTIYNKPPFGRPAEFSICDRGGRALHRGSAPTPSRLEFTGFPPGSEVLVRPETLGTMVKLLTPEQIAGAHADAAAEPHQGAGDQQAAAAGSGNVDPGTMGSLYYGINPPRHAEKAYQPGDPAPPLHPRPTTVGKSGTIVALVTTIYNKPPFGKLAHFSICDRGGRVLHHGSGATPSRIEFQGLRPGSEVLVRPETLGTMVKLLTPEQIAGGADD